jgi:hypothetical protein
LIHGAEWTTDGALSFDGVDDYVEVPDAPSLDLKVFTLDVRFQIDALPGVGENWTLLAKGEDPITDHANYYVTLLNCDTWGWPGPKIACAFENFSDTNFWLIADIDESFVGRSVRATCTLDGMDWFMYLDGSKVATEIHFNDRDHITTLYGQAPATSDGPLFFGAFSTSSCNYSGLIDEVRIYDHALTEAEIVPVPSAVLLATIGLSCAGWKLRRRRTS